MQGSSATFWDGLVDAEESNSLGLALGSVAFARFRIRLVLILQVECPEICLTSRSIEAGSS